MAIHVPFAMQPSFFQLYTGNNQLVQMRARQVCGFLSALNNEKFSAEADRLLDRDRIGRKDLEPLLRTFLDEATTWQTKPWVDGPHGHEIRVIQTLVDGREEPVYELGGTRLDIITYRRVCTKVLEWFYKEDLATLFQAIECRLECPANMYSGLDNMGNNMEETQ